MMFWIVGLLALATSLDSSLYAGRYTRGTMQMFSDMATGFGFLIGRPSNQSNGTGVGFMREAERILDTLFGDP